MDTQLLYSGQTTLIHMRNTNLIYTRGQNVDDLSEKGYVCWVKEDNLKNK